MTDAIRPIDAVRAMLRDLLGGPDASIERRRASSAAFAANMPPLPDDLSAQDVMVGGVPAEQIEVRGGPAAGVYSAPGRDVPTTQPGGRWYLVDGSSYAAAHVSGLLALVDERRPGARARLTSRADGEIDACATLLRVAGRGDCACARLAGRP